MQVKTKRIRLVTEGDRDERKASSKLSDVRKLLTTEFCRIALVLRAYVVHFLSQFTRGLLFRCRGAGPTTNDDEHSQTGDRSPFSDLAKHAKETG